MASKELLSPGDIGVCRPDLDRMIVWSSHRSDFDADTGQVSSNDLLLIIETRKTTRRELRDRSNPLTFEWKKGSYHILASNGVRGWVGAGWVVPVTI